MQPTDLKHRLFYTGGVFLFSLVFAIPVVGILGSSNIVWGEPNQYARIPIPGSQDVTLPSGDLRGTVAVVMPARGNVTPNLVLPDDLSLEIVSKTGGTPPTVKTEVLPTGNSMDAQADTQRGVWHISVPQVGEYTVRVQGNFLGIGVHPALWIGHGPPIPGTSVPLIGLVISLLAALIADQIRARKKS